MTSLRTKTRAGYVRSAPGSALLGALTLETVGVALASNVTSEATTRLLPPGAILAPPVTGFTGAIGAISAFTTALEVAAAAGLWSEFAARAEVALSTVGITGVTPASALALETT